MKKLLSALLLLLLLTLTARAEKPNVIIIYSDDHGYTDLGIHGIDANVDTPNMDALARGGVLMRAGYSSAPQCRPSRCGLLTGRIQNEFGFADNKADAGSGVGTLPRIYPPGTDLAGKPLLTIADRMNRLGYVTGFSGKWHCGLNHDPKEEYDPRSRGFDEYWVAPMTNGYTNLDLEGNLIPHQKKAEWPEELQNRVILQGKFAEAFVSRNKDKPFFLYFPIYGPHVPMIKKSDPYYKDFPKQDYPHYNDQQDDVRRQGLALLKAMDDAVGGLVQALQQHGLEKNTLILFAGDNGAPGKQTHNSPRGSWNGSNNVPLRGVKGWLHEGGIRVPMFAYWKGTIPAGQVVDEMVTTLDFTATTLALGGGVIPSEFDGVDLMPRMTGNVSKLTRDQPMYWDFYSGQAMRMGDWKLWRKDDTTVLFNIADDPSELTNLAYQHPDRVIEMSKQLDRWSESLPDSARYDPEKRGKNMISSLGGAPANVQPDPRYLVPYDNPVPTPYPTVVISPGGPAIIFESAGPENKQVKPKENAKPEMIKNGKGSTNRSATGNRPNLEKLFQRRDQNQDGFVTLEEFIGDPETRNVTALTRVFNKRDVNRDGRLTLEEMQVKLD
ncbi:sulfatase-like hydrolase/transferase [bacterium]|nr:sulfatase-like hydrolase/transferase [bacterium]